MSRQIIKSMNKDIDQLYLHQKEEIKDLCCIQKRKNSILKPTLLFVIVSLILCFHIYQIQLSIPNINTPQTEEITHKENDKKNSTNETESITTEDKESKKSSQESHSNYATEEKKLNKKNLENKEINYIGVYCLTLIDIFIIIYIFLKKTNKI